MEKTERRKLLDETLKKLNKGKKGFAKFAEEKPDAEYAEFGVKEIDELSGGGATKGAFTVLYGGKAVGKTTLALQQIAKAQRKGEICALVDLEKGWDKERARSFGVNLEELVLFEDCGTAEEALDTIVTLCEDKVVDLVLVDSIQAMSTREEQETKKGKKLSIEDNQMASLAKKLGKFFRVGAPHVYRAKVAVVLIGQLRTKGIGSFYTYGGLSGGNALEHFMSTCIMFRRGQKADAPVEKIKVEVKTPDGIVKKTEKVIIGFDSVLKLEKTRNGDSAGENAEIHIPFLFKSGFNVEEPEEDIEEIREKLIEGEESGMSEDTESDILKTLKERKRKKSLKKLTEEEFVALSKAKMIEELYPNAPETFQEIGE
jgi:RecA/RadA recombinase